MGWSAPQTPFAMPYYDTVLGDQLGVRELYSGTVGISGALFGSNGLEVFRPFIWTALMLAKKMSLRCNGALAGGTPVSNVYGRIYAIGSDGRPGKLLIDFGVIGSAGASLNTGSSNISSAVHASGFPMVAGRYFASHLISIGGSPTSGGTLIAYSATSLLNEGMLGLTSLAPNVTTTNTTSSGSTPAPDPATVTGYAVGATANAFAFTLAPS